MRDSVAHPLVPDELEVAQGRKLQEVRTVVLGHRTTAGGEVVAAGHDE